MTHTTQAASFRRIHLDSVDSTNRFALDRGRAGESGPLWITASEQTAGRGRRGRDWASPRGNLYASLLLTGSDLRRVMPTLPLLAGVAVHEALVSATRSDRRFAIKWPNDVLLDGAKVAGMLLEAESFGHDRMAVVVGCGINCVSHPQPGLYRAIDLAAAGWDISAEVLFGHLTHAFDRHLSVLWEHGAGGFREEWLARAGGIGDPIRVNLVDRSIEGRFAGIDADGFLLLDQEGGVTRISAGDLFFRQGQAGNGH